MFINVINLFSNLYSEFLFHNKQILFKLIYLIIYDDAALNLVVLAIIRIFDVQMLQDK